MVVAGHTTLIPYYVIDNDDGGRTGLHQRRLVLAWLGHLAARPVVSGQHVRELAARILAHTL